MPGCKVGEPRAIDCRQRLLATPRGAFTGLRPQRHHIHTFSGTVLNIPPAEACMDFIACSTRSKAQGGDPADSLERIHARCRAADEKQVEQQQLDLPFESDAKNGALAATTPQKGSLMRPSKARAACMCL